MQRIWKIQLTALNRCAAAALAALLLSLAAGGTAAAASAPGGAAPAPKAEPPAVLRKQLFEQIGDITGIPWHYLAAIDQYERTLTKARPKSRPKPAGLLGIYIPPERWAGAMNPDKEQPASPATLRYFGGIGLDGDGDGLADPANDTDILYTVANHILAYGTTADDFAISLWEYYHNTRSVQRVQQFSKVYEAFDRLDLDEHAFPLPVRSDYSYRSTWGSARSWGGRRIHEGTDIFARYGVPVRSTCYGVIEVKGWNKFGGWRIGIRDLDNVYHYYAHLSGFDKTQKVGDVIKPGTVIGWVGSSGYGKPGTQGKFPPHLHYGVYRDRGLIEWSFDPYPMLKAWEREEWRRIKQKNK
ncbi:peptidase M23 [Paenibacillus sambharensis]|uniref:Peptidase M23 n=1 Tax=Paenibacillus sambharensis TaxID=1803190 RepID=A0A2W1LME9_9BACL|nr:M23 family metallopeptidase [Paenibacillus sambharensis]PZD95604.1 peptidase M23 [Paenibacillus sambharensis]